MNEVIRILVIEDDDVDRMAVRRAFCGSNWQYRIVEVKDGEQALEVLAGNGEHGFKPHLILLDLNMPRMTGFEFLDRLRDLPMGNTARVIVVSTSENKQDKANAYKRNVMAYVTKDRAGYDLAALKRLVDAYVEVVSWP